MPRIEIEFGTEQALSRLANLGNELQDLKNQGRNIPIGDATQNDPFEKPLKAAKNYAKEIQEVRAINRQAVLDLQKLKQEYDAERLSAGNTAEGLKKIALAEEAFLRKTGDLASDVRTKIKGVIGSLQGDLTVELNQIAQQVSQKAKAIELEGQRVSAGSSVSSKLEKTYSEKYTKEVQQVRAINRQSILDLQRLKQGYDAERIAAEGAFNATERVAKAEKNFLNETEKLAKKTRSELHAVVGSLGSELPKELNQLVQQVRQKANAIEIEGKRIEKGLSFRQQIEGVFGKSRTGKVGASILETGISQTAGGQTALQLSEIIGLSGKSALALGGVAAAGLAVAAGLAKATSLAIDFDRQMIEVRRVANLSAADSEKLGNSILGLSNKYAVSRDNLARIAAEVAKSNSNLSGTKIAELTETITRFVSVSDAGAEQAGRAFSKIATIYQIPAREVEKVAVAINAAADATATGENEIIDSFYRAAPAAKQFGLSINDTVGYLAALVQGGVEATQGGTEFGDMLKQLTATNTDFAKVVNANKGLFGFTLKEFDEIQRKNPAQALNLVITAVSRLKGIDRLNLVQSILGEGKDATILTTLADQIGNVKEGFTGLPQILKTVNDEAQNTAKYNQQITDKLSSVSTQVDLFKTNIENAGVALGTIFLPSINDSLTAINRLLFGINDTSTALSDFYKRKDEAKSWNGYLISALENMYRLQIYSAYLLTGQGQNLLKSSESWARWKKDLTENIADVISSIGDFLAKVPLLNGALSSIGIGLLNYGNSLDRQAKSDFKDNTGGNNALINRLPQELKNQIKFGQESSDAYKDAVVQINKTLREAGIAIGSAEWKQVFQTIKEINQDWDRRKQQQNDFFSKIKPTESRNDGIDRPLKRPEGSQIASSPLKDYASKDGLSPVLQQAIQAAANEFKQVYPNLPTPFINEGFRTNQTQQQRFNAFVARGRTGNPAAQPGTSEHEFGLAVDVKFGGKTQAESEANGLFKKFADIANRYGINWYGKGDDVHFFIDPLNPTPKGGGGGGNPPPYNDPKALAAAERARKAEEARLRKEQADEQKKQSDERAAAELVQKIDEGQTRLSEIVQSLSSKTEENEVVRKYAELNLTRSKTISEAEKILLDRQQAFEQLKQNKQATSAQINEAEASVNQAVKDVERIKSLAAEAAEAGKKAITKEAIEAVKAETKSLNESISGVRDSYTALLGISPLPYEEQVKGIRKTIEENNRLIALKTKEIEQLSEIKNDVGITEQIYKIQEAIGTTQLYNEELTRLVAQYKRVAAVETERSNINRRLDILQAKQDVSSAKNENTDNLKSLQEEQLLRLSSSYKVELASLVASREAAAVLGVRLNTSEKEYDLQLQLLEIEGKRLAISQSKTISGSEIQKILENGVRQSKAVLDKEASRLDERIANEADPEKRTELVRQRQKVSRLQSKVDKDTNLTSTDKTVEELLQYADIAKTVTDTVGEFWVDGIKKRRDAELSMIQDLEDAHKISHKEAENRRKEASASAKKEFEEYKRFAIATALVQSAASILSVLADPKLETIGKIAAVTATVSATAIQVKNMKAASYFKGTLNLQDSNAPKGVDTIPIFANEGEAIIPTDKAQNPILKPYLKAIYEGDEAQILELARKRSLLDLPISTTFLRHKQANELFSQTTTPSTDLALRKEIAAMRQEFIIEIRALRKEVKTSVGETNDIGRQHIKTTASIANRPLIANGHEASKVQRAANKHNDLTNPKR